MVDLHTHTTASDGTDSVRELIQKARELRLSAVAKTDHNTTAGNEEFVAAAKGTGVRAIPGVEIATRDGRDGLHVVGLNVARTQRLEALLQKIRDYWVVKSNATIAALRNAGYDLDRRRIAEWAGTDNLNNGSIACYMLEHGMASDRARLFSEIREAPRAKTVSWSLTPREAVEAIRDAGGKAVWAHPLEGRGERADIELPFMRGIIDRAGGFDGIEVQHSSMTRGQRELIRQVAEERGIPESGGSDYHGANMPVQLGTGLAGNVSVPDSALDRLGL